MCSLMRLKSRRMRGHCSTRSWRSLAPGSPPTLIHARMRYLFSQRLSLNQFLILNPNSYLLESLLNSLLSHRGTTGLANYCEVQEHLPQHVEEPRPHPLRLPRLCPPRAPNLPLVPFRAHPNTQTLISP